MTTQQDASDGFGDLSELMSAEHQTIDRRIDPKRRRTRRIIGLVVTLLVLLLVVGVPASYVGWALTAPLAAPVATSQTPSVAAQPAAALDFPSQGAAAISVSGGDAYLGAAASGIWATSGTAEPRPIASISKLITALVILDARPLANADDPGPTITFDAADNDLYDEYYVLGATIEEMPTGTSMSQYDALATMLIPSASNYAEALSTWAFGSQSAFVGATRRWLAANGLTGTTIVEPTGISSRNVSTPGDLIAIGKLAAAHPVIAKISSTYSMTIPGPGTIQNTNGLLGTAGVTGLKTGNLGENTHNLLYTASLDVGVAERLSVTGVVLGGFSRESVNADVIALLDSIDRGFQTRPIATQGSEIGSFSTPWGSTATMVVGEDASIFTWSDTPITVAMQLTTPHEYEDGEVIGEITWTAGPQTETAPVVIEGTIEPPTEWWRLTHPDELGAD